MTLLVMDYRQALDYLLSFADYERASTSRIPHRRPSR